MPVVPPVPTAFHGAGQAPSPARPGGLTTSISNSQPSGAQEFDRRWVALEDEQGAAHARTPVQQSEAEMGEMRMQVLMNENMALRSALRMDHKMPVEALKKQTSSNGTPKALREVSDVITPQNEINRLQKELDQTASKLSKAESNVDRKAEMIQILRAQLDEADKKLGPDNEERMRMQEDLMQSRAQIRALQQDLDKERKLKEDAWERLLKVDPEKLESLQAQLEEEKLNCAEMLGEIRGLRAEKDAAEREAAMLISSLTAERSALMDEVQQARSGRELFYRISPFILQRVQLHVENLHVPLGLMLGHRSLARSPPLEGEIRRCRRRRTRTGKLQEASSRRRRRRCQQGGGGEEMKDGKRTQLQKRAHEGRETGPAWRRNPFFWAAGALSSPGRHRVFRLLGDTAGGTGQSRRAALSRAGS
jgi:uncharacterized coiled-coil DUF342 family protein